MELDRQIEALLFWRGEPVSFKQLAAWLNRPEAEIKEGLKTLESKLNERGIKLIFKEDEVILGTDPELSSLIEKLAKEERQSDSTKASLETLAVVLYRGPVTKSEIDYLRGVNSAFILRQLLSRGLVERLINPKDQRSFLYRPSFELLSYLGLKRVEELPEYGSLREKLAQFHDSL